LQFFAAEFQRVDVEQLFGCLLLFLWFLFFAFFGMQVWILGFFDLFFFLFLLTSCHVFQNWGVFDDVGCEVVFIIEFTCEGARFALASNDVVDDKHVHFGELAFGTADVFLNELVQYFEHFRV
jgi:hypothetical protein